MKKKYVVLSVPKIDKTHKAKFMKQKIKISPTGVISFEDSAELEFVRNDKFVFIRRIEYKHGIASNQIHKAVNLRCQFFPKYREALKDFYSPENLENLEDFLNHELQNSPHKNIVRLAVLYRNAGYSHYTYRQSAEKLGIIREDILWDIVKIFRPHFEKGVELFHPQ